jgi:hypothetical protein
MSTARAAGDVGVIDRGGETALGLESRAVDGIARQRRRNELERYWSFERHVGRAIDDSHAAAAGEPVDAVAGERRPDGELVSATWRYLRAEAR